jgi:recombination protein RecT
MSNELEKAPEKQDIRGLITSEQMRGKIAEVLPKYLTAEQMTRVMAGTIARVPKLAECTTASLLNALMLCAQAGILPDGRNAHLLPFKCYNKELECNEMLVQVIFDYKGLIQIAERNGVQNIRAIAVHEKDVFDYGMEGANVTFKWKPDFIGDRGKLVAFAATCIRDGNTDVEVMTKDEVDAIRKRSKASSSGPWVTDYAEMGKKTVLRRMSKRWPLSPEQSAALDTEAKEEYSLTQVFAPKFTEKQIASSIFGTQEQQIAAIEQMTEDMKDSEKMPEPDLADHDLM